MDGRRPADHRPLGHEAGQPQRRYHSPKPTAASGIEITEHLPNVAKQFKHLSIIRSLNSKEGDHARGTLIMNTGRQPNPLLDYPSIGSVLSYYQGHGRRGDEERRPARVHLGRRRRGPGAGFLGMKYAPFQVQNPGSPPENVSSPPVDDAAQARRAALFEARGRRSPTDTQPIMDAARAHKEVYEKALNLVVSTRKEVFNLEKDVDGKPIDAKLKEEYGTAGSARHFGRGASWPASWSKPAPPRSRSASAAGTCTTTSHARSSAERSRPSTRAMGTLVKDLDQRGKLKDTVIVWMGDFGRTPRINQNAGRDHWTRVLVGRRRRRQHQGRRRLRGDRQGRHRRRQG